MQEALEGSQAIAKTVAMCRPQVIAAYPITPQTHIVENLSKLIADGVLECEMVSVESEFSAASVVLGAVAAGSRSYTATSSQGILLMTEVLYNIAGMRLPMVLTCANRAVSAPISIWNDHQDSMAVRDAGWIQLYCSDNQEAVDTTIQAFRISERTELPVMVCVDGFTLTHTLEGIDLPEQKQVDSFLPAFHFSRALDPQRPITLGALVTPEYFTEIRHSHHRAMQKSIDEILAADHGWQEISGRSSGGLIRAEGTKSADTAILAVGSVAGTLREAMTEHQGEKIKLLTLRCFRPFPEAELRKLCKGVKKLIVLERALSPGAGGIIGAEVRAALSRMPEPPEVYNYAAGLGGRDMPLELFEGILKACRKPAHDSFSIFDVQPDKLPAEER